MDLGSILSDSVDYTRDALVGKWVRWLTFIILALPFSLVQFVFDPQKFMKGTQIDWKSIPWGEIALLVLAGIILSFFINGYVVRIFRGGKPAPDFTQWGRLFVDGIRLTIVWILLLLPALIVGFAGFFLAIAGLVFWNTPASGTGVPPTGPMILAGIILLIIGFILAIVALLYGALGAVRFARSDSIREGIRFGAIGGQIRRMGWLSYILALVVLFIVAMAFGIVTGILSLVPYLGWILVLIITPLFTIFEARYFTLVYLQGEPAVPAPEPAPAPAIP